MIRDEYRTQLDERAFAVLTCLLRHAEQVVPRSTLVAEAWPGVAHVNDSAVSKTMRRLRIALGPEAGRTLSTVYGVGYRLAMPAVLVPAGASLPRRSASNGGAMAMPPGTAAPAQARPAALDAAPKADVRSATDRAHRHRIVIMTVLLLCSLLAAWLLLAPVAR